MLASALVTAVLASAAAALPSHGLYARERNSTANNLDLIHDLELAPTAKGRVNMLQSSDWLYDFLAPLANAVTTGDGEQINTPSSARFSTVSCASISPRVSK